MSDVKDVVNSILAHLAEETRDLSAVGYKEVLELLIDDLEISLDAAKGEAVDDEVEDD